MGYIDMCCCKGLGYRNQRVGVFQKTDQLAKDFSLH